MTPVDLKKLGERLKKEPGKQYPSVIIPDSTISPKNQVNDGNRKDDVPHTVYKPTAFCTMKGVAKTD